MRLRWRQDVSLGDDGARIEQIRGKAISIEAAVQDGHERIRQPSWVGRTLTAPARMSSTSRDELATQARTASSCLWSDPPYRVSRRRRQQEPFAFASQAEATEAEVDSPSARATSDSHRYDTTIE